MDVDTLSSMVEVGSSLDRRLARLNQVGGAAGLARELGTDVERGIDPAEAKTGFTARRAKYGKNFIPPPPPRSLTSMILEGLQDKTLIMLMISATVSLILGVWENPSSGWIEGTAILTAVVIVVSVAAGNDYQKERQFRKLNERKNNKPVKVVRGGEMEQISVYEVNVGEIVIIDTGDILCADGIWLSGFNMKTDESSMTGEVKQLPKGPEDPFLLSSTMVVEGIGKMMVVCVGPHSQSGKTLSLLNRPVEDTPLQVKLESLADQIAKFGMAAASLILISLCVKLGVFIYFGYQPFDVTILNHVIKYIISSITIVVVAVPEGLPLAVTISLAYSMTKMMRDNNLVRRLEACETMGGATTICSDKTGTLTMNKMTVMKIWVAGRNFESIPEVKLTEPMKELLVTGIACNSTAYESKDETGKKLFIGSQTECALLGFCRKVNAPFEPIREKNPRIAVIPFSSTRKRMSSVIKRDGKFCFFTKGASEIVLGLCTSAMQEDGSKILISEEIKDQIKQIIQNYAETGLRTIALAFSESDYEKNWDTCERDLTLVAIAGIKDPVRPEVPEAVRRCQSAGIVVRMVTGDNPETAKEIARECGILKEGGVVICGEDYKALSEEQKIIQSPKICVMARSSPTDKFTLVRTLKMLGHVVAVTGDGTNDAPALKEANIGFSMGITGTEVSKEASAIILMDDNFASIVKAVMWGRNVYDSIRKFLQFQLTVNLVAVSLAFIGALTNSRGEAPLKPVQLLWVNLIMDTMAALALATEEPTPALLDRKPYGKSDALITHRMWRNVIVQAVFQLTVNLVILYYGHVIFGIEKESIEHLTIVFNIFVLCQLFNEVNSRKLNGEINVFAGFFTNHVFVGVMAFTCVMQFLIIQFGGNFAGTRPLSLHQWAACFGIAALGLPIGLIPKIIPYTEPEPQEFKPENIAPSKLGAEGWGKLKLGLKKKEVIDEMVKRSTSTASILRRFHRHNIYGFDSVNNNPKAL
ncbi:calcium-translocating P-type ATPase [Pelomyxa schiedti]|nr:calcium-translocating P-type ATPase [Pelomyxa schiedti]